jgi:hypothetical protein
MGYPPRGRRRRSHRVACAVQLDRAAVPVQQPCQHTGLVEAVEVGRVEILPDPNNRYWATRFVRTTGNRDRWVTAPHHEIVQP